MSVSICQCRPNLNFVRVFEGCSPGKQKNNIHFRQHFGVKNSKSQEKYWNYCVKLGKKTLKKDGKTNAMMTGGCVIPKQIFALKQTLT